MAVTRPILFSSPMIRALLGGHKTETRRLAQRTVKTGCDDDAPVYAASIWQKVQPGDLLWVRENWRPGYGTEWFREDLGRVPRPADFDPETTTIEYLADGTNDLAGKNRPGIHMPRWASRLTLEVTATRLQPVTDISEEDAIAEGIQEFGFRCFAFNRGTGPSYETARLAFAGLWKLLHGEDSWRSNPLVVPISFKVYRQNVDALLRPKELKAEPAKAAVQ